MKLKLFLITFFLVSKVSYSQFNDFINLEDTLDRIEIDSANLNNIWQIGIPSKTIFDSAKSLPNAIVTDTANYYPINNQSSFQIGFELFGNSPYISFAHKFDTDANADGGYVEVSFDTGATWLLLHNQISVTSPPVLSLWALCVGFL